MGWRKFSTTIRVRSKKVIIFQITHEHEIENLFIIFLGGLSFIDILIVRVTKKARNSTNTVIDTHPDGSWWCISVERWDHITVVLWGNKEFFLRSCLVDQSRSIVQCSRSCLHILGPGQHNGVILPYNIDAIFFPFFCHVLRQFKVLWASRKVWHFSETSACNSRKRLELLSRKGLIKYKLIKSPVFLFLFFFLRII